MDGLGAGPVEAHERLNPSYLMDQAMRESGLDDFGDRGFLEPLTRFLDASVAEGRLTEIGEASVQANVVRCLVNRLRLQDDLKRHPEILDEEIRTPVIIVGLPRTGTTKLQRMLSSDPSVQHLWLWRLLNPAPFPGWRRDQPDARIAVAQAFAEALATRPEFLAAHPMAVGEVDEDLFLMEMTFEVILPFLQVRVPSFLAWSLLQPRHGYYSFEKVLLQYLQWQDGGGRGRPWVLKAVTHLGGLEALADTFPDATIVHTHRNVVEAVPSTARTTEGFRTLLSDDVDLDEIGEDVLRLYSDEMAAYLVQRDRLGARARIVDVSYRDIVADPMKAIREIYQAQGRRLSPEVESRMRGWSEANPQYRFGRVEYSPARYGLSARRILQEFATYSERFAPWLE